ncbi:hypothetical protein ABBQ38_002568 [Trebouxia sp. C0009 RCD-2024]
MAAEMARSPAAPGLLFTAAAVHGFSAVSEVARNLADKGSIGAEALGADITRQLQQASDDIAIQTESSQTAFQEWKGLMSGILSEEASKLQAELDHASRAAAAWQQQSSEVLAQIQDGISSRPNLNSHPLGLPSMKLPELQSGWLADAIQERWAEAGSSSAWPTSFSVAMGSDSSSDSMSMSDDEDAKAGSLPSFMSKFTDQARDVTAQLQDSSDRGRTFLDRKGSKVGSAASDFATSVYSKVVHLPGQGFGVSNFSPPNSPGRFPGKMGQTGPSSSRQLPKPASSTGLLPSPAKAKALPITTPSALPAPSASPTAAALPPPHKPTAALPLPPSAPTAALPPPDKPTAVLPLPPSATAAALPSPSAANAASPHMTSPARKAVTQKGGVLSPRSAIRKAMRTSSAVVPLVRTSNSRQSMTKTSLSGKPPAVTDESSAGIGQSSSTASLPAGHSPSSSSGPSAAGQHTPSASAIQSPAGSAFPHHLPSSASPSQSPGASSAVPAASSSSTVPAAAASHSGKPPAAEGRGLSLGTGNNADPSASTSGLPLSAAAEEQGFSPPSANNATASVDSLGDAHQTRGDAHQVKGGALHAKEGAFWAKVGALWAREDAHQTKGDAHQAKGDAHQARADAHLAKQQVPQARDAGGQQMPGAEEPKAVGTDTKSQVHPAEQHWSCTESMQAQLPSSASDTASAKLPDQAQEQPKTPRLKHVRVVRPEPTPNWRTRRPLTPPPAPVQQGHPLSAPPAQSVPFQTPAADSAGPSQVEHAAPQTTTNSACDTADHSSNVRQPTTAAAAATAVDSSTTTVVDSIPWGTSGTATTRSRQDGMPGSPQAGGGGGSITGGSTGGSGGGSPRPSGDSGGEDDRSRSSSTWGQWWLKLLLVGGGATAVSMSSTARTAIWDAVSAVRTRFASGRTGEHHQEEEVQEEEQELLQQAEDEEVQAEPPAALSTDQEEGIATNIKVKEGDTAWSLAEEYSGTGQAWPEVVSSNPHANMAKPGAGMSVRVSVRMGN